MHTTTIQPWEDQESSDQAISPIQTGEIDLVLEEELIHSFLRKVPSQKEVCVVMPAFNEEKVIASSLEAILNIFEADQIFVVSDGSHDKTAEIARQYTPNVLELKENSGKATALKKLIDTFNLIPRYKYLLFSDADSRFTHDFFAQTKKEAQELPACMVGTVTSDRHGLISAYRTYEYAMTIRSLNELKALCG